MSVESIRFSNPFGASSFEVAKTLLEYDRDTIQGMELNQEIISTLLPDDVINKDFNRMQEKFAFFKSEQIQQVISGLTDLQLDLIMPNQLRGLNLSQLSESQMRRLFSTNKEAKMRALTREQLDSIRSSFPTKWLGMLS
jgi:hypothetical protein